MEANLYYIQSREISINNCFILFKGSGVFETKLVVSYTFPMHSTLYIIQLPRSTRV